MIENVRGSTSLHTWGVFDGHGEHGHHVSRIIRERLGQIWLDQGQHLGRAFKSMQLELDKSTVDVRCSGATAVMIVMKGSNLEVANCGDSRAVLGKKTNGQVCCVELKPLSALPYAAFVVALHSDSIFTFSLGIGSLTYI